MHLSYNEEEEVDGIQWHTDSPAGRHPESWDDSVVAAFCVVVEYNGIEFEVTDVIVGNNFQEKCAVRRLLDN